MEANFQRCLSLVLKSEGGWSDDPADNGGATMKGITLATFRRYRPGATKDDLRTITDADLSTIYRDGYWSPVKGDDLPAGVDYAVFDFAVNSGTGRAAKFLQRIVGVKVDGAIGPVTLAAVGAIPASSLINELCNDRLEFLRGLADWPHFGKGWSARVETVRAAALAMVLDPAPGAPAQPSLADLAASVADHERRIAALEAR